MLTIGLKGTLRMVIFLVEIEGYKGCK